MTGFPQPDPALLALVALKGGVFLALVAALALIRVIAGRRGGPSRWLALVALLAALAGLAALFGPALSGTMTGPAARLAFDYRLAWGGFAPLIAASLPLVLSAVLPGRRWWGIDVAHAALIGVVAVLWGMTT